MCRKPSQVFTQQMIKTESGRVLLTGAGVLTDVVGGISREAAGEFFIILRDSTTPGRDARILFMYIHNPAVPSPVQPLRFTGMNLEFEQGLVLEYSPDDPLTIGDGFLSIGAYIQDRSPDPMAIQLARVADELARVGAINAKLADFVKGLELGDPTK